jgi:hypothetical protein
MSVTRKYKPRKYYSGLSATKRAKRAREIQRFGSKGWKDASAYVGFSTDKGVKTRTSSYVQTLRRRFHKMGLRDSETRSLRQKSKHTGVPYKILRSVLNRGMAAWRTGHRPGAGQQQWGYARVASFLTCGKTYLGPDSDLVAVAKRGAAAKRWWAGCNA